MTADLAHLSDHERAHRVLRPKDIYEHLEAWHPDVARERLSAGDRLYAHERAHRNVSRGIVYSPWRGAHD